MAANDDGNIGINITVDNGEMLAATKASTEALKTLEATTSQLNNTMSAAGSAANAAAATLARGARGMEEVAKATQGAHMNIATFTRELMVMGREIARGNYSRLSGSATILAGSFGLSSMAVLGLVAGLAAVVGPIVLVAYEMSKGAEEAKNLAGAITATGNAAGITASDFYDMSKKISDRTGASVQSVKDLELQMVRTGKVGSESFALMAEDAEKMAIAMGIKPAEALKQLMTLTDDTAKSAAKLNEQYHFLTEAQWLQIRAMEAAGDKEGAMKLALQEMDDHIKKATADTGYLAQAFHGLSSEWDNFIGKLQAIGRVQSVGEQIAKLQTAIQNSNKSGSSQVATDAGLISKADAERQLNDMGRILQRQKDKAEVDAKSAKDTADAVALHEKWGKTVTKLTSDQNDLATSTELLAKATLEYNSAKTAQQKIDAQAKIAANQDDIKSETLAIKKDQKKVDGPAGAGGMSQYAKAKGELDQLIISMDGKSKEDQLRAEIDFWQKKEDAINRGTKAGSRLWQQEENARLSLQIRLNNAVNLEADKQAKIAYDVEKIKADGIKKLQLEQAAYIRDGQKDELDIQIQALQDKLSSTKNYNTADLAALQDLFKKRADILKAGALADENASLRHALTNYNEAKNKDGGEDLPGMQRALNEMLEARQNYANAVQAIDHNTATISQKETDAALARQTAACRSAAKGILDSFRTMTEGLIERTTSWQTVWINAQRKMLDFTLQAVERMVLSHIVGNQQKVLSDKESAVETGQINFKAALAQINNDAISAFASVYQSVAKIPVVGPVLAPIAAATAYGSVMAVEGGLTAFSARDGVGEVANDGDRYTLHKKEMVLPEKFATPLRNMLAGGGNTTNNSNTSTRNGDDHYHIHQSAGESGADLARRIVKAKRDGHLSARDLGFA